MSFVGFGGLVKDKRKILARKASKRKTLSGLEKESATAQRGQRVGGVVYASIEWRAHYWPAKASRRS